MNITLLSMQVDQEVQAAEMIALSEDDNSNQIFEIGNQITDAGDAVSEAVQTSAVLESIREHLSNERKPIPENAAQALKLSIEHMSARLGYKKNFNSLSMESYSNDPKRNVRIALEGIGEILKSIWDAIINSIKKVVGWIGDFFEFLFGHNSKVNDHATKIEIRLKSKDLDSKYKSMNDFDFDDYIKKVNKETEELKHGNEFNREILNFTGANFPYVRFNNSVEHKGSDIIKHYDESIKYLRKMFDVNVKNKSKSAVACCQTLMSLASGQNSVDDDLDERFVKTNQTINQMAIEILYGKSVHGKSHVYESPTLLGDYIVYSNRNIKDKDFTTRGYKCGVDKAYLDHSLPPLVKPAILGIKEGLELCTLIKENSSIFEKKDVDSLVEILDDILIEINTKKSTFKDEQEGDIWKSVQDKIKDLIHMVHSSQIKLSVDIGKYVQSLNNNLLIYIQKCERLNDLIVKAGK